MTNVGRERLSALEEEYAEMIPVRTKAPSYFDVVFDGPPGPESGRFIEVEDEQGASISVGEWVERPDGFWALRIPRGIA